MLTISHDSRLRFLRLESILVDHLVLNLRSYGKPHESSEATTITDIFFRTAYGQAHRGDGPRSTMDTILGNIGEPLRVHDNNEEIVSDNVEEEAIELNSTSV